MNVWISANGIKETPFVFPYEAQNPISGTLQSFKSIEDVEKVIDEILLEDTKVSEGQNLYFLTPLFCDQRHFIDIDSQDLIPAPKETKDVGKANQLTTELAKEGVKNFSKVTEAARSSYRSLDVSRSRLKILQDNPDLITGGKLSELSTNVLITLGSSLGIEIPATADAEAAQLLMAQGVEEVGQTIKAFGAGTGLSDADREFAKIGAGATQELTAENIKRMVELRIEAAEEAIRLHQSIYNDLKEGGASASSLSFYQAGPNLPADLSGYYD